MMKIDTQTTLYRCLLGLPHQKYQLLNLINDARYFQKRVLITNLPPSDIFIKNAIKLNVQVRYINEIETQSATELFKFCINNNNEIKLAPNLQKITLKFWEYYREKKYKDCFNIIKFFIFIFGVKCLVVDMDVRFFTPTTSNFCYTPSWIETEQKTISDLLITTISNNYINKSGFIYSGYYMTNMFGNLSSNSFYHEKRYRLNFDNIWTMSLINSLDLFRKIIQSREVLPLTFWGVPIVFGPRAMETLKDKTKYVEDIFSIGDYKPKGQHEEYSYNDSPLKQWLTNIKFYEEYAAHNQYNADELNLSTELKLYYTQQWRM
ncbi:DhNV_044 [Dikerogammarus haemobaphes nudivirus]|nr:DhNV_044 [Dikerogammarus haemobaphes nudivirus]